jgi:hypothetical protein
LNETVAAVTESGKRQQMAIQSAIRTKSGPGRTGAEYLLSDAVTL